MSPDPDTGVLTVTPGYDEPEHDDRPARPQPRHARPRGVERHWTPLHLLAGGLAVALIAALGIAGHLSRQLDQARSEKGAAEAQQAELAAAQERTIAEVAELRGQLSAVSARVRDASQDVSSLRDELAAAEAAAASAEEQAVSATSTLTDLRGRAEALASSVLGSVDPMEACRQAADRVAERAEQAGRSQRALIARLAREAADACEAAAGAVQESMPKASEVLAGT